ncbi:hypothetical protein ACTWPT_46115 [Nonomuraea sp. 3N208]|uniref:hypothetical protein n=1 Tax=Nonomuraea sp. 3N208 TaxID=3457421 RepID=UPI003FD15555
MDAAVERVALALQAPRLDPHGPTASPGDVDDALTLLGHARAVLDSYELHLLDAARAAGRDPRCRLDPDLAPRPRRMIT